MLVVTGPNSPNAGEVLPLTNDGTSAGSGIVAASISKNAEIGAIGGTTLCAPCVRYIQGYELGAKSVKDIKEQDVYMGDMPLMTMNGTFVVNGSPMRCFTGDERVDAFLRDAIDFRARGSGHNAYRARLFRTETENFYRTI